MPRATVSTAATRYDLKTLPEGYVELRKMSYGAWLTRTELAMDVEVSGSAGQQSGNIKAQNRRVTQFEFQQSLVSHNLEDESGNPLDVNHVNFLEMLDPVIGQEIGQLIDDLHKVDEGN